MWKYNVVFLIFLCKNKCILIYIIISQVFYNSYYYWLTHDESISPPFVIILSSSQKPALNKITANACIFWSNIVSANKPSIIPPNAIKSGGTI